MIITQEDELNTDIIEKEIYSYTQCTLTDKGREAFRLLVKEYSFTEVSLAIKISAKRYLQYDEKGNLTEESIKVFFRRIKGICKNRQEGDPFREIYYIRGILKNRLSYYDEKRITQALLCAKNKGCNMKHIKEVSKKLNNWLEFKEFIHHYAEIDL